MIKVNNKLIEFDTFPNGELYIKTKDYKKRDAKVEWKFESNDEFFKLSLLKNTLDQYSTLYVPYFPYSRMDREIEGFAFSKRLVAGYLNVMNWNKISTLDIHSNNNDPRRLENIEFCVWKYRRLLKESDVVVYPDKGAERRYKEYYYNNMDITFNKKRDEQTGKILSIKPEEIIDGTGRTAVIVDDICSRGGTFMGVAKHLKEMNFEKIILVVTHCEDTIFDGDILKTDLIDEIHTTNSILTKQHKKIIIEEVI